MKVKLLKKVRRNFRIVRNALGCEFLQEKSLIFGWENYNNVWELAYIQATNHYNGKIPLLKHILRFRYSKYTLKEKIRKQKEKQLKTIWYDNK